MLRATDLPRGKSWSRNARRVIAALAISTACEGGFADEAGSSSLDEGSTLPAVEFQTGPVSGSSVSPTSAVRRTSSAESGRASVGPSSPVPEVPFPPDETPSHSRNAVRTAAQSSDDAGSATAALISGSQTQSDGSEFDSRVDQIICGEVVPPAERTLGDWWYWRTQRMMNRVWQVSNMTVEFEEVHPIQATRNFIAGHTLEDDVEFEVDVYDSKPITLESPIVEQTAGVAVVSDETAEAESDDVARAPRLKTDLRSIQPTLGYALKNIDAETLPEGFDRKLDNGEYVARSMSPTVLQWAPTNFYHYPIYFEDPALERYGHTYGPLVQPLASTGRFATQLIGLPYQMALHPVHSHEYALGRYRPGDCAPKKHYQIPFNEEATLVEAAVIAGLIIALP